MKQKTLKLRGLHTPRIFLWIMGFHHSHILKTAVVDSETGLVCSGYITEKCKLFYELGSHRIKALEGELKAVRTEAAGLIAEVTLLQKRLEQGEGSQTMPVSVNDERKLKRKARFKESAEVRYEKIIRRLIEIEKKIDSCELIAYEELQATSNALQGCFAAYCHGMLLKGIQEKVIPEIDMNRIFQHYADVHKEEMEHLRNMTRGV